MLHDVKTVTNVYYQVRDAASTTHPPGCAVVQSQEQMADGRLATSAWADQSDRLSHLRLKTDLVKNLSMDTKLSL